MPFSRHAQPRIQWSPTGGGRGRIKILAAVAMICAALGIVLLLAGADSGSSPPRRLDRTPAGPARATVAIISHGAEITIPRSFLGFSTEYWTLPVDQDHQALYRRVISLVHLRSDGRFVLRIGGSSSDHTVFDKSTRGLPGWAYPVTSQWIVRTAQIVRQNRLQLIIDLNLLTATPAQDAVLARRLERQLPRGSIVAFQIGNEPDSYNPRVWHYRLQSDPSASSQLPTAITARTYATSFGLIARALDPIAPRAPLQGPEIAHSRLDRGWISQLLAGPHPRLQTITVHQYPYTACARPDRPDYATVPKLLSLRATAKMVNTIKRAVTIAHRAGLPVRVSEFNSVTCGGVARVSDSFATALWAPNALFALVRAGVEAADLHVRAFPINAPFVFEGSGIVARPLLYGLILFTRMLGPGSCLVPVRVQVPRWVNLRAWAVSQPHRRLSVLLTNGSARAVKTDLILPSRNTAVVQRLLAPSAYALTGETLAGQRLGADARWHGRRRVQTVVSRNGHYLTTIGPTSASLITVSLRSRSERSRAGEGRPASQEVAIARRRGPAAAAP